MAVLDSGLAPFFFAGACNEVNSAVQAGVRTYGARPAPEGLPASLALPGLPSNKQARIYARGCAASVA